MQKIFGSLSAFLIILACGWQTPASSQGAPAAAQMGKGVPAAPAETDINSDKARYRKDVLESKDLPNLHEVHPYLYRSGEPTEAGMDKAKAMGVTTVIDLRGGDRSKEESAWAQQRGMKYINLPMSAQAPTKQQVETFEQAVEQAEKNKSAVLVHCAHGSDRTGCMVGIWRVKHDNWDYDKTYAEMRHYWFGPKYTKLSGAVRYYADQHAKSGAH